MASVSIKQTSPRRLAELLDEHQEPFVLEMYLLERGYRIRKSLELGGRSLSGCCSTNHNYKNNSKKYFSYHIGANSIARKSSAQFSSITRTIISKFSLKKPRKKKEKDAGKSAGRCSSASCSTAQSNNTWYEYDTDAEMISIPSPAKNETAHDEPAPHRVMNRWQFVEENKQCSPDSVLDEIDLLQAIPVYNVRQAHEGTPAESRTAFPEKVSEDAILSASLWELLEQLRTEKPKKQRARKPFPEYLNSKKALQQHRQLLFDCVRDAAENGKQQKNSSNREKGLIMGPEEIGKFICRNLKAWGKLSADETNIMHVLRMDLFGGTDDQWGGFEVWKKEIVVEIGDGIVDYITEEIISDMIDHNY